MGYVKPSNDLSMALKISNAEAPNPNSSNNQTQPKTPNSQPTTLPTPLPKPSTMLRRLLHCPISSSKTLTLSLAFSTHRGRNKPPKRPPFTESELNQALSRLPSRFTPSDLTSLLSSIPNPHLSLHLFTWAHHHSHSRLPPDPTLFHLLIKKLGRARLYPQLHSLASLALASLPASLPLFNTIIYFFCQSRALSKAIHVYSLLRDSPDPASRPTLSTYNLLFSALLGIGPNSYIHHLYMDTVRHLFRQMLQSGVRPDITAMNFVVRGYVNSMHLNDALRVFHQFENVYGVEPDGNTYGYLLHGLCAQGRTRNAMEMYGEMRRKGVGIGLRAGNSLVSALAMGGESGEAVRVMWEVVGLGVGVEVVTCRTVVEGVWRERGREEAVGLVEELREREVVDGRVARELMNWVEDGCAIGVWNE